MRLRRSPKRILCSPSTPLDHPVAPENLNGRVFGTDRHFLGADRTDSNGTFGIQFTELAFRDMIEQRSDVYLRIFDPSGNTELWSTIKNVRRNARVEEHFEIAIPAARHK